MKTLLLFISFLITGITVSSQVKIFFPSNSTKPLDRNALRELADSAAHAPAAQIVIIGHTDSIGSESSNTLLSMQRAQSVKAALVALGVRAAMIEISGEGESLAAATNNTAFGRSRNRRAEVSFTYTKTNIDDEEEGDEKLDDIGLLYDRLADKGSEFCIDPNRDTVLVAQKGSVLVVPARTFAASAGCPCIRIIFHEYFSMSDMVLNNLTTTTSGGRPMVSGGMSRIEAFCGTRKTDFNDGMQVTVMIPAAAPDEDMKLYLADRNSNRDILDWQTRPGFTNELVYKRDYRAGNNFHGDGTPYTPPKCPFFFCKIRRFIGGIFNGQKETKFQQAQESIANIQKKESDFVKRMSAAEQQLGQAIEISGLKDKDAIAYYVYKTASFSYHNIDRLMRGEKFSPFYVDEKYDPNKDIRIVLRGGIKTVLPAEKYKNIYQVRFLFSEMEFTVIGLKYMDGKIYCAEKFASSAKGSCTLSFNEVSEKGLKDLLERVERAR